MSVCSCNVINFRGWLLLKVCLIYQLLLCSVWVVAIEGLPELLTYPMAMKFQLKNMVPISRIDSFCHKGLRLYSHWSVLFFMDLSRRKLVVFNHENGDFFQFYYDSFTIVVLLVLIFSSTIIPVSNVWKKMFLFLPFFSMLYNGFDLLTECHEWISVLWALNGIPNLSTIQTICEYCMHRILIVFLNL